MHGSSPSRLLNAGQSLPDLSPFAGFIAPAPLSALILLILTIKIIALMTVAVPKSPLLFAMIMVMILLLVLTLVAVVAMASSIKHEKTEFINTSEDVVVIDGKKCKATYETFEMQIDEFEKETMSYMTDSSYHVLDFERTVDVVLVPMVAKIKQLHSPYYTALFKYIDELFQTIREDPEAFTCYSTSGLPSIRTSRYIAIFNSLINTEDKELLQKRILELFNIRGRDRAVVSCDRALEYIAEETAKNGTKIGRDNLVNKILGYDKGGYLGTLFSEVADRIDSELFLEEEKLQEAFDEFLVPFVKQKVKMIISRAWRIEKMFEIYERFRETSLKVLREAPYNF
jgi:hypothetical protein